jgi:hypothetical protein
VTDSSCKPRESAELIRRQAIAVIRIGNLLSYDGAVRSRNAAHPSVATEILGTGAA